MTPLTIERYRFRLTPRGWVRGSAATRVLAAAQRRIPAAIVEQLAARWPDEDRVIREPLRLYLRVPLAQLAAACDSDAALAALVARLVDATLTMAAPALARAANAGAPDAATTPAIAVAAIRSALDDRAAATPLTLLVEWQAAGRLHAMLAMWPEATLRAWFAALLRARAHRRSPSARPSLAAATPLEPPPSSLDAVERDAAALRLAIESIVASAVEDAVGKATSVQPAASPTIALTETAALDDVTATTLPPAPSAVGARSAPLPTRAVALPTRFAGERDIACALPFVLLQPLSRLGWLDALGASFAAFDRVDQLAAVATAIAYKVLTPPERGWRRDARAELCAATFAGSVAPATDSAIASAATGAEPLIAPLDTLVATALLDGHARERPLLIARCDRDWVLLDCDGLFPIAWGGCDALLGALGRCDAPIVVFAEAADVSLLAALERSGKRFVTDAPPARGESWRAVRRRGRTLFTNDASDAIVSAADELHNADEVAAMLEALRLRRAVPATAGGALERSLDVAVGAALGEIAWTLFRAREPATPRLALERFADLGARVCIDDRLVDVRLPRGRRTQDLETHRLLGEVRVPWLDGVTVRVRGG